MKHRVRYATGARDGQSHVAIRLGRSIRTESWRRCYTSRDAADSDSHPSPYPRRDGTDRSGPTISPSSNRRSWTGGRPEPSQDHQPDDPDVAPPAGRVVERRVFIAAVTGGLLATPFAAEAQKSEKIPRGGILGIGPAPSPPELAKS